MTNEQWFMRALRDELGLTQKDVARVGGHGLNPLRVSILERGVEPPTDEERKVLLRAFIVRSAGRAMEQLIIAATD